MVLAVASIAALPAAASAGAPPTALPGGKYEGKTKRGGKRVVVRADADGTHGVIRVRCARVNDRFRIDADGGFVAKKRRRGRVVLKARGSFDELKSSAGKIKKLRGRGGRCKPSRFDAQLDNVDGLRSRTISYGPYHVAPSGDGGHHHGGANVGMLDVQKPCEDCYLVGAVADLTDADGQSANFDRMAMLHHIVFFNQADRDSTCKGWGERFFASGNERTPSVLPAGYGYRVEPGDDWRTIAHLMNMGDEERMLNVAVTFYYLPASADVAEARPFWLDVNNCGNSEYSIPPGISNTPWEIEADAELSGRLIAAAGHLHDDGVRIELRNSTTGELLCRSRAGFDTDPAYMGHIESMSRCTGDPLAVVRPGDRLTINSIYDSPTHQHDVMGIVVGYLAPAES